MLPNHQCNSSIFCFSTRVNCSPVLYLQLSAIAKKNFLILLQRYSMYILFTYRMETSLAEIPLIICIGPLPIRSIKVFCMYCITLQFNNFLSKKHNRQYLNGKFPVATILYWPNYCLGHQNSALISSTCNLSVKYNPEANFSNSTS